MSDEIAIRKMAPADAAEVAALSGELGYPVSAEDMEQRIRALALLPDHAIYIACVSNRAVAWIDASIVHHLASAPSAEIGGLVVSSECRSRGIGTLLVECAERWAASRGVRKIVVRSRSTRERAHQFYLRQNFEQWKTQAVFQKDLNV